MTQHRGLLQSQRRLRDEPFDMASWLVEHIGPRGSTSLGEAQAAAYLDGRLRRAGLRVSADAFAAPVWRGWGGALVACIGCAGVGGYYWYHYAASILFVLALAISLWFLSRADKPLLVQQRPSQNIIATRAGPHKAKKRVVLLAPLDTPPLMPGLVRRLHDGYRPMYGRLIACCCLVLFALIGVLVPDLAIRQACWYAQIIPAAYLILSAALDVILWRGKSSPGGVNHAGALATLLASAEDLTALQHIELWVVALGATPQSGLTDLLRRYPFERAKTLFIALEGIGSGSLAYVTRVGLIRQVAADPELLRLVAVADAQDPLIDAEPRRYRHSPTIAEILCKAGWQAISIGCFTPDGQPPYRGSADDTPAILDANVLNRAVRLVVGLVRQIDIP